MGKRDVTDWTQKGGHRDLESSGSQSVDGFRQVAGKAGLLMCAAAIIAVLAKGVKNGGLDEYREESEDSKEEQDK